MKYHTGDTPGRGIYICTNYSTKVELKRDDEALPVCPKCGNQEFTKQAN